MRRTSHLHGAGLYITRIFLVIVFFKDGSMCLEGLNLRWCVYSPAFALFAIEVCLSTYIHLLLLSGFYLTCNCIVLEDGLLNLYLYFKDWAFYMLLVALPVGYYIFKGLQNFLAGWDEFACMIFTFCEAFWHKSWVLKLGHITSPLRSILLSSIELAEAHFILLSICSILATLHTIDALSLLFCSYLSWHDI